MSAAGKWLMGRAECLWIWPQLPLVSCGKHLKVLLKILRSVSIRGVSADFS